MSRVTATPNVPGLLDRGLSVKIFDQLRSRAEVNAILRRYPYGAELKVGRVEELNCSRDPLHANCWLVMVSFKRRQPITSRQYLAYLFRGEPLPED